MIAWILSGLWADRVRTGLVALGVLWGTLGLASLLAFGGEMLRATGGTARNFGVDLVRVAGAATTRPSRGFPAGRSIRLAVGDEELLASLPSVRGAVLEHNDWGRTFRAGEARHTGTLVGTQPGFADLRSRRVRPGGRFLSARDEREERRVCYLGAFAARALFSSADPVGREVDILGTPFRVVGVGPDEVQMSNYNGDERNKVYVPASTYRALTGRRSPSFFVVGLVGPDAADGAKAEILGALGARYGFDPADAAALEIQDYTEIQRMIGAILGGNRALTALVGLFGFLVAALGVANATWVRVEETRREIGLAVALGARRRHVMAPPLVEASLVALVGGAIGLGLAAASFALAGLLDVPLEVRAYLGDPRVSLALGGGIVGLLAVAGALSGWIPARRAARVDPMVVLREE
ncbi:MAG: ABC transporter permease [Planctomycetota bacterium]